MYWTTYHAFHTNLLVKLLATDLSFTKHCSLMTINRIHSKQE